MAIVVNGLLGLLGLAAIGVVARAVTTRDFLLAVRGFLVLGIAFGLVLGGAWLWVRHQMRLPAQVTVEGVRQGYHAVLDKLGDLAHERNLAELTSWKETLQGFHEQFSGPGLEELFGRPEILAAHFELPGGRGAIVYVRPGSSPGSYWTVGPPGLGQSVVTRGWTKLNGSPIDTVEYIEGARDASGASVTLHLTLQLDSFSDRSPSYRPGR